MRDMMHRLIDSFSPVYLQPMTLPELYQRMCMNLVQLPRHPLMHACQSLCQHLTCRPCSCHSSSHVLQGYTGHTLSSMILLSGQQKCCLARHGMLSAQITCAAGAHL